MASRKNVITFISMINQISYIYLIENIDLNPNKVYIGKSTNVNRRKHSHNARFGKGVIITIIDEIPSIDKNIWRPIETYWINQFSQWGFEVINKNQGGGGPEFHSKSTKIKMGGPKSLQHIKKLSKPRINKEGFSKPKPWLAKPILQLNPSTYEIINQFPSCVSASKDLGVNKNSINNNLKGRAKTAGGFIFEYI